MPGRLKKLGKSTTDDYGPILIEVFHEKLVRLIAEAIVFDVTLKNMADALGSICELLKEDQWELDDFTCTFSSVQGYRSSLNRLETKKVFLPGAMVAVRSNFSITQENSDTT